MTRQFSVLSLFTLLLLTMSLGVLSFSPPLQTITAAFAQTPTSSSSSLADEIIGETVTSVQDSSAGDNILEDNNEFADEDAAVEQENAGDQEAVSIGLQDQDSIQDQDEAQDAANTNVDSDVQVRGQLPPLSDEKPSGAAEPPECNQGTFNPDTDQCELPVVSTTPQCPPGGFTFNPATNQCERTVTRPPS